MIFFYYILITMVSKICPLFFILNIFLDFFFFAKPFFGIIRSFLKATLFSFQLMGLDMKTKIIILPCNNWHHCSSSSPTVGHFGFTNLDIFSLAAHTFCFLENCVFCQSCPQVTNTWMSFQPCCSLFQVCQPYLWSLSTTNWPLLL